MKVGHQNQKQHPYPEPARRRRGRLAVSAAALGVLLGGGVAAAGGAAARAAPAPAQVSFDEQRIEFAPGTDNATREGNVADGQSDRWILRARAGQVMDVVVDSVDDNTVFAVFAPDRTVLATVFSNTVEGDRYWSGTLPVDGDYQIEVATLGGPAFYMMKVWIGATYQDPLGLVQRMSFAPGTSSGRASGSVIRTSTDLWFLNARAGQTMDVTVTSVESNSTFDVIAPDGVPMTAPDVRTTWTGVLPTDGDYRVAVQPTRGNATYTITVRITGPGGASTGGTSSSSSGGGNNAGGTAGPHVTRRLSFAPGTDNGVVSDSIAPGQAHRWLLGAAAGQTMAVFIESDVGDIPADVYSPTGVPLITDQYEFYIDLAESGDYVVVVNNYSGIVGAYTLTVYIT